MKINTKNTFFIFLTIVLFSCSADDIDPIETIYTEPVFKISGTLSQEVLDIQAGEKNFYMYTDLEIDNSEVPTFIGRFAAEAGKTVSGDEELTFYIKGDGLMQSGIMISVEDALREGDLGYLSPSAIQGAAYRYDFFSTTLSSSGSGPYDFSWELSNGDTSTAADPFFIVNSDAPFSATFSATGADGVSSNYVGQVSPNIDSDSTLLLDLSYAFGTDNDVIIEVQNQGLSFVWSTGETEDSIIYNISQLNTDGELITVTASNSYGATAMASVFLKGSALAFPGGMEVFTTLFNYEVSEVATQSLGSVVIEYKKDGVTYSSNLGEQNQSEFSINSIEEFRINENGFPTKKLQINFDCLLFNELGESIPIEGTGFIGVAYQN